MGDFFYYIADQKNVYIMKNLFLLSFLMTLTYSLSAQKNEVIHLWEQEVPNSTEKKHAAVVTDNNSNGVIRLTDVTDPTVTIYRPDSSNDKNSAIVVCPGGGYQILAFNLEGTEIAEWLAEDGYTVYILQYRVPGNRLGALNDVQRAIRIARKDFDRVGVMGFSAGGHLSANASTNYQVSSYTPVDDLDKLSAKPDYTMLIYPAYLDAGENRALSPEIKVDSNTPPMFICAAGDDPYANSSLVMATALRDAKVPVELHIFPSGGHGFGSRKSSVAATKYVEYVRAWLKTIN